MTPSAQRKIFLLPPPTCADLVLELAQSHTALAIRPTLLDFDGGVGTRKLA